MSFSSREILDFIRVKSSHPMKMKELARELGISSQEYSSFRKTVKDLIQSGELVKLKRGRIGLASEMNVVVGEISVVRSGIGFVKNGTEADVMIPSTGLLTAMDGDTVMIRLGGFSGDRRTGNVLRIVKRVQRNIVGIFHISRQYSYVHPDNPRLHRDIYIPP